VPETQIELTEKPAFHIHHAKPHIDRPTDSGSGSLEINMMIAKHRQDIAWRDSLKKERAKNISTNR
jgi:hypothetical protein